MTKNGQTIRKIVGTIRKTGSVPVIVMKLSAGDKITQALRIRV